MDPNRLLTMKEAALRAAEAAKAPRDTEGAKRQAIASALRLAGEATGQSQQAAESADEIAQAAPILGQDAEQQEMLGGPDQAAQATGDSFSVDDPPGPDDSSLIDGDMDDQDVAEPSVFEAPTIELDDSGAAPFDSPRPMSEAFGESTAPSRSAPSPSAFSEMAGLSHPNNPLNFTFDAMQGRVPRDFSSFERIFANPSFPFFPDRVNAPPRDPDFPPEVNDFLDRRRKLSPGDIQILPLLPRESAGAGFQLLSDRDVTADARFRSEEQTPINYPSFAEAAVSNEETAPVEKQRIEFESNPADVKKDAIVAFLAMEPAILKAIDRAGEQDRHDDFMREASRRACL